MPASIDGDGGEDNSNWGKRESWDSAGDAAEEQNWVFDGRFADLERPRVEYEMGPEAPIATGTGTSTESSSARHGTAGRR